MYRDVKNKKGKVDTASVQRWHTRTLVNMGGVTVVALPKRLIKWDRFKQSEPFRWTVGDQVEVALTPSGEFRIRPLPTSMLRGYGPDNEADNEALNDYGSALPPKRLRKKRKVTIWGDSGPEKVIWEDLNEGIDEEEYRVTWADEIKKFRIYCEYTQREVGHALGVTPVTVSYWETGRSEPTNSKKDRLRMLMLTVKNVRGKVLRDERRQR